jgi:pimeloyl-ACP methyl ester carboxylesterase
VRRIAALCLVAAALMGGCTSHREPPRHVRITVTPAEALLDAPVSIRIYGLRSHEHATITASAVDAFRVTWFSRTTFVASSAGVVDTGQRPVSGSYDDIDPMGVIDRMKPTGKGADAILFTEPVGGYRVSLEVTVDGDPVAHADVSRSTAYRETERHYRPPKDSFYGNLYLPKHMSGRRPSVLLFAGSGGGMTQVFEAQLLAAHGYPSMALAYFGISDLPEHLDRIPLEYFVKALKVLRHTPGVDPHHILTWGVSRGSEAALLLAARFPRLVFGAVALVPSSVVNTSYPVRRHSAWTLHGHPLSFASGLHFGDPTPPERRAIIPVERIRGPVVVVCGGSDFVWPSCQYSHAIVRRLAAHHRRGHATELRFPLAGHAVGEILPYVPTASTDVPTQTFGGTVSGDVRGRIDAWQHILKLLAGLR